MVVRTSFRKCSTSRFMRITLFRKCPTYPFMRRTQTFQVQKMQLRWWPTGIFATFSTIAAQLQHGYGRRSPVLKVVLGRSSRFSGPVLASFPGRYGLVSSHRSAWSPLLALVIKPSRIVTESEEIRCVSNYSTVTVRGRVYQ